MVTEHPLQLVWFKRDLRCVDHAALNAAAARGPVLPLFIVEPEYWQLPDTSQRQWDFACDCLLDLRHQLAEIGQPLVIRIGDAVDVLQHLHKQTGFGQIWSHEETGNGWTYQRDQRVLHWCREKGLVWTELQQHGTQRRLKSRNGWAKAWDNTMARPFGPPPALMPLAGIEPGDLPGADALGLKPDACPHRQRGGRGRAVACLNSFLQHRGANYRVAMSSPLTAESACSRLSPHFAWGSLSIREAAQATWKRQQQLHELRTDSGRSWQQSMVSFSGRLHWHCHFIQKLEDEPEMEFRNLHSAYEGMRPSVPDAVLLEAWSSGQTGLPFVDACMRSLNATGWINFRMRAMLMAVASYHLWLDWRAPGLHLARKFTDYEPGIHWPQVQMQSGTTGINTVRIYNPVKQGMDQDPQGIFTRKWVPELADVADQFLHQPWRAPNAKDVLDVTYPFPVVDHLEAAKQARQKVWAVRGASAYRQQGQSIQQRHGSRKSGIAMRGRGKPSKRRVTGQLSLKL